MQLSNDLNSYCVNESINSDNTDLVDLNNKCLNGGFNSDHIDISDLNNKCLNESIFNNDSRFHNQSLQLTHIYLLQYKNILYIDQF
jgi:hypothetical protein